MMTLGSALAKWRATSRKIVGREVAAVGELDALGAAIGAGLDHLEADFGVGMEKDRDHALAHHRLQHRHTIVIHSMSPREPSRPVFRRPYSL